MSEKFKNKYTIKSVRLKRYDYAQNGLYFVTICTKDREEFLGKIEDGKMVLSEMGKIAEKFWKEIPNHFLFVILDEFVIMPNHVHGIVEINWNNVDHLYKNVETQNVETPKLGVSTEKHWKPGCLGLILNQYKRICTIEVRKTIPFVYFAWQSRFYDHIIRNEESLNKIREYIRKNPQVWERDRNNVENIFI